MAEINDLMENAKQQTEEFNSTQIKLNSALDKLIIDPKETFELSSVKNTSVLNSIDTFKDNLKDYVYKIKQLIADNKIEGITTNYLRILISEIEHIEKNKSSTLTEANFDRFIKKSNDIINMLNIIYTQLLNYLKISDAFKQLSFKEISQSLTEVKGELSTFRRLRNIADTGLTEDIYNNAVKKYQKNEKKYRKYFYRAITIVLFLAFLLLLLKSKMMSFLGVSELEFWILKISLMIVGVTLISYFIKQSSHYQRLADQNYQTQVELQAYPSFMESVPTNEAAAIRKELALKYFGKEIDGSSHKDMSNLISDQMKNTTEMIKATTDVLKQRQSNS